MQLVVVLVAVARYLELRELPGCLNVRIPVRKDMDKDEVSDQDCRRERELEHEPPPRHLLL